MQVAFGFSLMIEMLQLLLRLGKEDDFQGEQLIVTTSNLNTVMKMLAKGFKFNFFTNNAEQQ
mgnify:FL=1